MIDRHPWPEVLGPGFGSVTQAVMPEPQGFKVAPTPLCVVVNCFPRSPSAIHWFPSRLSFMTYRIVNVTLPGATWRRDPDRGSDRGSTRASNQFPRT